MRINEVIDVEEGWKDWVAAGAIGAAALGGGAANAKTTPNQHDKHKPVHTQQVQKQQVKQQKPELKPQAQQSKPSTVPVPKADTKGINCLSNNPTNEIVIHKEAKAAGLKGAELAQFLGQMKHESWDFDRLKEKKQPGVKDYYAKKYDMKYSPGTAKILGNKHVGDGERYHGRGFVQLTGRDNYRMAGDALGIDLLQHPELAEKPNIAAKIAVWYWNTRVKPKVSNWDDTAAVTKAINPALRGLQDRADNFKDYMRII